MARLTRDQVHARACLNRIAALGESPERVAAGIASALAGAIGWDGFRLFGVEPQTRLINRVLAASPGDDPTRDEWLRDVYLRAHEQDLGFIELTWLMRRRLRAVAFQDRLAHNFGYPTGILNAQDERVHRANFARNEAPIGGTILANFNAGDQWLASLQAYRRQPGRPFRASDVAFVHAVAPLIGEILAAALVREAATAGPADGAGGAAGIVVLERSGRVRFATPVGERWFHALRSAPGEATAQLPAAVWGTMAGLSDGRARAVNGVRFPGGSATIEATPGGSDGTVALVITPVRELRRVAPPDRWGLTAAEEWVAALVVQGLGNRAVAERLSISEHTVEWQWHLRRVFERLDVRSRAQLTARSFHDTALPGLSAR